MKAEVKVWPDTGNIELWIFPEDDLETALLHILSEKTPRLMFSPSKPGHLELTFLGKARVKKP